MTVANTFSPVPAALSEAERHARQQALVDSGAELRVGDSGACPLPLTALKRLTPADPGVVGYFGGGLTGEVFCLEVDGKRYSIKRKRPVARVANADGQHAFLTEVQRRADVTRLKQDPETAGAFGAVVDTLFASYRHGILVSPWIDGAPLTEFNTNGTRDSLFHGVERFETRSLFAHLLRLELAGDAEAALATYRIAKAQAVRTGLHKLAELTRSGASPQVLAWQTRLVRRWQRALDSQAALQDLYVVEGYRSHLLDVQDDLSGKSCTPLTLQRIDAVEQTLRERFSLLQDHDGLFFGDEQRDQQQLLVMNAERRQRARRYQL